MADEEHNENAPAPDETVEQEAAQTPEQAAAEAPAAEPAEVVSPKERRRRARVQRQAPARDPRSPEQRDEERNAVRRAKATARSRRRAQERARGADRSTQAPAEPPAPRERTAGRPKVRQGVVVSDRADKTITVRIDVARRHRRYEKIVRSSARLHAHDERNEAHAGDTVRVVESRPQSRTKRWRLLEVLERAR